MFFLVLENVDFLGFLRGSVYTFTSNSKALA